MNSTTVPAVRAGYSAWFVAITAIFVTTLITANIIAVKLIWVAGHVLPAAIVIFPMSYLFADVLTEVYGYSQARRVIWLGFLCNVLAVFAIWIGQVAPPAPFWNEQQSYTAILGYSPRLLLASLAAYLAGEFLNSFVLARLKVLTAGRWLWTRTISSTFIGQGVDSLLFISIAFGGALAGADLLNAILTQWLVKTGYEVVATPLTYAIVNFLKRREGLDVFDRVTNFNPFQFSD